MKQTNRKSRRGFIRGVSIGGASLLLMPSTAMSADAKSEPEGEDEITPTEDLMREHGILKRVLLVYREIDRRLDAKRDFPADALADAAGIIRHFIEDYHEKLEEDFLFPRFEKAGNQVDLTRVLREQHLGADG
jgi:hypothetical protein